MCCFVLVDWFCLDWVCGVWVFCEVGCFVFGVGCLFCFIVWIVVGRFCLVVWVVVCGLRWFGLRWWVCLLVVLLFVMVFCFWCYYMLLGWGVFVGWVFY